jgi:2-dehydropantoate 2-reductase
VTRFAIVGAGAIGAYVGAALVRGGSDVTLIARGAHLAAMREHGVQVNSPRGDFHVDVEATDDLEAVRDADVVVLAVKAYSLRELAPRVGPRLGDGTAVLGAQNGVPWWYAETIADRIGGRGLESVDPGGEISAAIPTERVIGCVTYCSTEIERPGVIRHIEGTRFTIGEPFGQSSTSRCDAISEAFQAGGLKCPIEADIAQEMWLKLVGNVAFNPVAALTGSTLEQLGELPESRRLLRAIMEESAAVAAALDVELPVSIEHRLQRAVDVGAHKPSTLQDLEAGKPLEIDCLTGAVLELADRLELPAPHTQAVHACVSLLEARRQGRENASPIAAVS